MRQEKNPFISIVLPVYNESAGIGETLTVLANYVRARPERYELIFVNDGSTDDSADQIRAAMAKNPAIRLVDFSRNFGHSNHCRYSLCQRRCSGGHGRRSARPAACYPRNVSPLA